jgi:16S rRNA processing protein RimM
METDDYIEIGMVVNAHGVNGELKIIALTDDPLRYNELEWVYIETGNKLMKCHIDNIRYVKNAIIIRFKEINNMTEALSYKGSFVKIDRNHAIKLPDYSYFIFDLIGCAVYNVKGIHIGTLTDVLKTGSNDVYEVENVGGRKVFIPALKSVVKEVSVIEKKMIVEIPEGLIDDEV